MHEAIIRRHLGPRVLEYATDFRVTMVNGARQAGKTTLLNQVREQLGGGLVTFDDSAELAAARSDPHGYVEAAPRPFLIDEVQRAGEPLILAIKAAVDRDPRPGSFVLSGSTRFLTIPKFSESLAGRAALVELWPFSVAERAGVVPDLVQQLFANPDALLTGNASELTRHQYMQLVCVGGFPEVTARKSPRSRAMWFSSYLTTVTQREVRELAQIRHLDTLPRLLRLLAAVTAQELNPTEIARGLGLSPDTVRNYLPLLETVYLVRQLPAWSRSLTAKVKRRPKLHLTDSGLAASLMNQSPDALARPGNSAAGALLETFVVNELTKLAGSCDEQVELYHYRDRDGQEVDCVLETPAGQVVGIEVKASASVEAPDFRHLAMVRDKIRDQFTAGVVFYTGSRSLKFGDRLLALPVSALWNSRPVPQLFQQASGG